MARNLKIDGGKWVVGRIFIFKKKKKEGKEKRRETSNKEAGDTQVTLFSAC